VGTPTSRGNSNPLLINKKENKLLKGYLDFDSKY
jgi:hypothetical protein